MVFEVHDLPYVANSPGDSLPVEVLEYLNTQVPTDTSLVSILLDSKLLFVIRRLGHGGH
jgi:hypothetical protein